MTLLTTRLRQLIMVLAFAAPSLLFAQNNEIEWTDDDETETKAPGDEAPRPKRDEATVTLDGELYEVGNTASFPKGDSIDVSVRDLLPNSWVAVHLKKAGMVLEKKGFFANEKGELDLLIYTGDKKLKGSATVIYHASSGKKVELDCEIAVE